MWLEEGQIFGLSLSASLSLPLSAASETAKSAENAFFVLGQLCPSGRNDDKVIFVAIGCCLKVLDPSFFVLSSMRTGFVYNILCQVWKAKPALFQWHGSRLNTSEAETESAEGVFRPVHRYLLFLACTSFMSRTSRLRISGAQTFDLHMFNLILEQE